MAVPMKNGGMSTLRVIFYVVLSGVTTGIGAFFGALVGRNITKRHSCMSIICSRSNDIYSVRRINTRIKSLV